MTAWQLHWTPRIPFVPRQQAGILICLPCSLLPLFLPLLSLLPLCLYRQSTRSLFMANYGVQRQPAAFCTLYSQRFRLSGLRSNTARRQRLSVWLTGWLDDWLPGCLASCLAFISFNESRLCLLLALDEHCPRLWQQARQRQRQWRRLPKGATKHPQPAFEVIITTDSR